MIRFWMLAILLIGLTSDVSEARGRNRGMRYHGGSSQYQSTMRYSSGTTQAVYSQASHNGSQAVVRTAGFSSVSSSTSTSTGQGNSLQAWAEDEARMMAERGTCGHIRSAPPGCFVGVGCGMTCMGSGRLVAEASCQGKMVRVWQR
jgi:hypothetical protein